MVKHLKAPFPWFGGKRTVADIVWKRLGNPQSYVEPFFGSGAMLLARPHEPRIETVNDLDGFVANFWRAIAADPDAVAHHADWPVSEIDLGARHYWLVTEGRNRLAACLGNPDGCDAQVAGWWVWGISSWIGGSFAAGKGPWIVVDGKFVNKHEVGKSDIPGINLQRPHLTSSAGVNGNEDTYAMFSNLYERLRNVRVCNGDWARICKLDKVIVMTGVFLDPPYADTADRTSKLYSQDSLSVAHDVREWAIANGNNKLLRICLAGYDGEHIMPDDWARISWRTRGGYGNQGEGRGRANAGREMLWFSPHCLSVDILHQEVLF